MDLRLAWLMSIFPGHGKQPFLFFLFLFLELPFLFFSQIRIIILFDVVKNFSGIKGVQTSNFLTRDGQHGSKPVYILSGYIPGRSLS